MQKEYGYIGYFLYLTLLLGGLTGVGAGILTPFRRVGSLAATLPTLQKHLVLTSLISYLLFAGVSTGLMAFSNLKM